MSYETQNLSEQERSARRHLVGRKIFSVGAMSDEESCRLGLPSRPFKITLDDNTTLVVVTNGQPGELMVRRVNGPLVVMKPLPHENP